MEQAEINAMLSSKDHRKAWKDAGDWGKVHDHKKMLSK